MRKNNLTKLVSALLCLSTLLFIGLPDTPTLDEQPQYPTVQEPVEFYPPNGVIATNTVVWDTGVFQYLPEGYAEFYDEYAAENGVIIPYQASTLDASLIDMPDFNRSNDIAEHIMPSLVLPSLRMTTGTTNSEINESYIFSDVPTSNRSELLNQKKHLINLFNAHFEPSDHYKLANELDCEFSNVYSVKSTGKGKGSGEEGEPIYKLSNFKIEINDLTSVVQLSCIKAIENESVFITISPGIENQERDPNNLVPKIVSFLEQFQGCLNDQIYITPNRIQPKYAPSPGLHLKAELSAIYLFPLSAEDSSCSSPIQLGNQCDPEVSPECVPSIDNQIGTSPNKIELNELPVVENEKEEDAAVETSFADETKTKIDEIKTILLEIQTGNSKQLRKALRLQKELVVLIAEAESNLETDLLKRLVTKLRKITKSLLNSSSEDSVILSKKEIRKLLRKISKRLPKT